MKRVRIIIIAFSAIFFLSGLTVFPVEWEIRTLLKVLWGNSAPNEGMFPAIHQMLISINNDLPLLKSQYPYIFYGFDWLGFAFIIMTILFLGTLRDPVRNKWIFQFALISCILVIPMAFIFAPLRGLPWTWAFVDSSFGVFGAIPLIIILKELKKAENQ